MNSKSDKQMQKKVSQDEVFWYDNHFYNEQEEVEELVRQTKQVISLNVDAEVDQLVGDGTMKKQIDLKLAIMKE